MPIGQTPAEAAETLFQKTADEARRLIATLEVRVQTLRAELEREQIALMRLKHLAALSDGDSVEPTNLNRVVSMLGMKHSDFWPDLALRDQITKLLFENDVLGGLTAGEVRNAFLEKGAKYAESTIYSHLGQGKKDGLYSNENKRWELTAEGRAHALGLQGD